MNMDATSFFLQSNNFVACLLVVYFLIYENKQNSRGKQERFAVVYRERGNYVRLSTLLRAEGQFERYHRMRPDAFEHLLRLIAPELRVNEHQSRRRTSTDPLSPPAKLLMVLSWLAGGCYHHIRVIAGVSKSYFYDCVYHVMNAICACEDLALVFPTTPDQLRRAAAAFRCKSEKHVIAWCVAAIDGWLVRIRAPHKKRVANVAAFYSGRYKTYGMNVQFSVDANCRFTSFSIKSPGGTNDIVAFDRSRMQQLIAALPPAYFAIGDAAYPLLVTLMTPYSGTQLDSAAKDNYNYAMSQLRIRAEMGLGLFTNKWRIFDRHLAQDLRHVGLIVHTGMRVHNFVIDSNLRDLDEEEAEEWLQDAAGVPEEEDEEADEFDEIAEEAEEGAEAVREAWVDRVVQSGVTRP
eukprot:GHVU01187582.1.p1 GENE.GHVU01187582.1~~GHVU01187582.1.p1  ORF type:complete len:406 (-),score=39.54 GHVU01187582.1:324-1541(-)